MTYFLFVGYRPGARLAAEQRGTQARWLLDASKPIPKALQSERWIQTDFLASEQELTAAASKLCDTDTDLPIAVIALTEKAVVPAAFIRNSIGVDGISVSAAHRCHDKVQMKDALLAANIACAPYRAVDESTTAQELIDELGLPLVLKQRNSSGSRGTVVARTIEEVAQNLVPGWMAESFVDGHELSIESLVVDGKPVFVNLTEYLNPGWANVVPAQHVDEFREAILEQNRRTITALGVDRGITHHEVFITSNGLVTGELAARPPGGYLMQLLSDSYDFDMWQALFDAESGQDPQVSSIASSVHGIYILHPGAGLCTQISGLEQARQLPNISRIDCTLKTGQVLGPRLGVGQSAGCIFAHGTTRQEVVQAMERAREQVVFEIEPQFERSTDPIP